MRWIFDHIGLIVFLVIAFTVWRKAKAFLRQIGEETEARARTRPRAKFDPEEIRRVEQIQEEIRRKIAERRGGDQRAMPAPRSTAGAPPLVRPAGVPPTDPFGGAGGTVGRVLAELERRLQPPPVPTPVPEAPRNQAAQLERQQQLAEQLRIVEENRVLSARRAADISAAERVELQSERGMRAISRGRLLADLRDPQSLRRAFVLREVLGAPVGWR